MALFVTDSPRTFSSIYYDVGPTSDSSERSISWPVNGQWWSRSFNDPRLVSRGWAIYVDITGRYALKYRPYILT